MSQTIASAPARICLAGEDLDWMGGGSILSAVRLRTYAKVSDYFYGEICIITDHKGIKVCLELDALDSYSNPDVDFIVACIKFVKNYGIPLKGLKIEIISEMPIAAGVSSSAALILACLKSLFAFSNVDVSVEQLCHFAFVVESKILGRAVGQMDLYSCGMGGLMYISCESCPPRKIIKCKIELPNFYVVIIDTNTPRDTGEIIEHKSARFEKKEAGIILYQTIMKKNVNAILRMFHDNIDLSILGRIITQCQESLRNDMRVSTPIIDRCVNISLSCGAYGAKLTGTGFGGCLFAFVPSLSTLHHLLSSLPKNSVTSHITELDDKGILLHTDMQMTPFAHHNI